MNEVIQGLLERQSHWQKSRKDLSWPEKIRMAERVRAEAAQWSSAAHKNAVSAGTLKTANDGK